MSIDYAPAHAGTDALIPQFLAEPINGQDYRCPDFVARRPGRYAAAPASIAPSLDSIRAVPADSRPGYVPGINERSLALGATPKCPGKPMPVGRVGPSPSRVTFNTTPPGAESVPGYSKAPPEQVVPPTGISGGKAKTLTVKGRPPSVVCGGATPGAPADSPTPTVAASMKPGDACVCDIGHMQTFCPGNCRICGFPLRSISFTVGEWLQWWSAQGVTPGTVLTKADADPSLHVFIDWHLSHYKSLGKAKAPAEGPQRTVTLEPAAGAAASSSASAGPEVRPAAQQRYSPWASWSWKQAPSWASSPWPSHGATTGWYSTATWSGYGWHNTQWQPAPVPEPRVSVPAAIAQSPKNPLCNAQLI